MPLALAAALLWMIHPLQTESVTYIIQRTEALMGLFYLFTLYCVIRGATSRQLDLVVCAAVAACLLGMATKEVMATAPLIVLLYDRTFLAGSFREAWRRRYGLYLALGCHLGRGGIAVDFDRLLRRHHRFRRAEVHLVVVFADAIGRDCSLPSAGVLARRALSGLQLAPGAQPSARSSFRGSWWWACSG